MKLENGRLQITFAGEERLQTQRFDATAIIAQVVLDGKKRFCTPEQVLPGRRTTFGMGLCGEFVLEGPAEETKAGDWFCKPGVGLLRQNRDWAPYDMWQPYEVRRFPVAAESGVHTLIFRQSGENCNGYAMDIEKRFSLQDNRLILDITVRNTGSKRLGLKEYQHNFLSLDGLPVSEGYVLELGCDQDIQNVVNKTLRQGDEIVLPSAVKVCGDKIDWQEAMDGKVLYHRSEQILRQERYSWRLSHTRSKAAVGEQTMFTPQRIDIWAVEHCVCPEFYFAAEIAPGESTNWRRIWTFEG